MSSLRRTLLAAGSQSGLLHQFRRVWGRDALTVLAYHRITDLHQAGFDTFVSNVSATPAAFAAQMEFVAAHYHVVSAADVQAWLENKRPLPPHPLLITFDDGYRDNLENAFPILQQHGFPAVIFLATDYMGKDIPFFWDLIAYCFYHTTEQTAVLPCIGSQQWHTQKEKTAVIRHLLSQLKQLPNHEKETAVQQLPALLNVLIPDNAFAHICLTWDEVRQMAANNITFGAHTKSHPILTRISIDEAAAEITGSQARITAETGQPVTTFAYPNGQPDDFTPALQDILRENQFSMAFTLLSGPARAAEMRHTPFAIRRIFIGHGDDLPRFTAKLSGLPRVAAQFG